MSKIRINTKGNQVLEICKARKITHMKLRKETGVSTLFTSRPWMVDTISKEQADKISAFLDIPVEKLFPAGEQSGRAGWLSGTHKTQRKAGGKISNKEEK